MVYVLWPPSTDKQIETATEVKPIESDSEINTYLEHNRLRGLVFYRQDNHASTIAAYDSDRSLTRFRNILEKHAIHFSRENSRCHMVCYLDAVLKHARRMLTEGERKFPSKAMSQIQTVLTSIDETGWRFEIILFRKRKPRVSFSGFFRNAWCQCWVLSLNHT